MLEKRKMSEKSELNGQGNTETCPYNIVFLDDDETKIVSPPQEKNTIQHKYWCFTLNNYEESDIRLLCEIMEYECEWYIFQEETGESGTPHLQGTINLSKRQRLSQLKKWHNKIHWEWTKCVKASIEYCQKYESRSGNIYYKNIIINEPIKVIEPYGWQLDILDIIKNEPDDRTIYWFWEPYGNVGKSSLCKYLAVKHDAIVICGKGSDIKNVLIKKKSLKLILVDIPRSNYEYFNYGTLEEIKNGMIFSGKYEGGFKVFNPPHIICFANEEPQREQLSSDRWDVRRINKIYDEEM